MSTDDEEHHWQTHADEWIRWVREPGHDAFWGYRDEFCEFLPLPGTATLEVGCGEGRISRELTHLGHHVTATDIAPSLLDAAKQAESAEQYHLGDAADLPFPDNSFDCVVAYNMLMDVPDMHAVVAEAARVLADGGHLVISIVHPFTDHLSVRDAANNLVELRENYYGSEVFSSVESRGGFDMHFAGWSRPLQDYTQALTDAGLAITRVSEPRPAPLEKNPGLEKWTQLPLFLWLDATSLHAL